MLIFLACLPLALHCTRPLLLRRTTTIQWCKRQMYSSMQCTCGTAACESPQADFDLMLDEVNLLYLGCTTLVLLDGSSISRFWPLFEYWMSLQDCVLQTFLGTTRASSYICADFRASRAQACSASGLTSITGKRLRWPSLATN